MTVQTTAPVEQPAGSLVAYQRAPLTRSAAMLEGLREWRESQILAMEAICDIVMTDAVPLTHWPMPPGQTLRSFPNPRMKHPQETAEDHRGRVQTAVASAAMIALRGFKFGMEPPEALESMFNIRGKIGMYTKRRQSIATGAGIVTGDVEMTRERVTCYGIHPVSGDRVEITITMEDARLAGWVDGNDNYRKVPADMLWSRAMGRVLDRVAGHVLSGVVSIEDARDAAAGATDEATAVHVSAADITGQPAAIAAPSGLLAQAAERMPEPTPAPVEQEPTEAEVPAGQIGEDQWRAINAAFVKLGVTGPGQSGKRLAVLSYLAERGIAKGSDLTANEAAAALDALTAVGAKALVAEVLTQPEADQPEQPAEAPAPAEAEHDLEPPADDPWRDAPQVQG